MVLLLCYNGSEGTIGMCGSNSAGLNKEVFAGVPSLIPTACLESFSQVFQIHPLVSPQIRILLGRLHHHGPMHKPLVEDETPHAGFSSNSGQSRKNLAKTLERSHAWRSPALPVSESHRILFQAARNTSTNKPTHSTHLGRHEII